MDEVLFRWAAIAIGGLLSTLLATVAWFMRRHVHRTDDRLSALTLAVENRVPRDQCAAMLKMGSERFEAMESRLDRMGTKLEHVGKMVESILLITKKNGG